MTSHKGADHRSVFLYSSPCSSYDDNLMSTNTAQGEVYLFLQVQTKIGLPFYSRRK